MRKPKEKHFPERSLAKRPLAAQRLADMLVYQDRLKKLRACVVELGLMRKSTAQISSTRHLEKLLHDHQLKQRIEQLGSGEDAVLRILGEP